MTVRILLLSLLAVCGLAYALWWARVAWSRLSMPSPVLLVIGFVTNFFDALGIGSFAPTTTAFKMLRLVPDELIPGTMIVGHSLPVVAQALIMIALVPVESVTLLSISVSTIAGGWLGAGVVSRLPRRGIQLGMGVALLLAAFFMAMDQLDLTPGGGEALGLSGPGLVIAIVVTFFLGAMLMLGIGHYGPSLVLYSILGMDTRAAFPIMMGSGGFVGPAGAVRFLKSGRYDLRAALGLALAGVPAVLIAAFIVKSLPLYILRWMVVVVVVYAAVVMLRSAMTESAAGKSPAAAALLVVCAFSSVASAQTPVSTPDITGVKFVRPTAGDDYEKREVMIPMRDGVRLFTSIVIPKGAKNAPVIMTRTPYNAAGRTTRNRSTRMLDTLPQGDEVFVADGYIRIFQDVRGKYGSEGEYLMTRPLRGPLNPTPVDHSTDTHDTIEWLLKNLPESNGRIGMLGSSYEGFTVVMALVNPHPALKVAAPMSPMIDGWMGDDWFHYGAFRQTNFDFFTGQNTARGAGTGEVVRQGYDDYENFRRAGSAGDYAKAAGLDQLPFWRKVSEHPAYDSFWQHQALDKIMGAQPLAVPTMWIQGIFDQEDMWGGVHAWAAVEPKDAANDKNFLVLGPWRHSGMNYDGSTLGPFKWEGDTALQFRRDVLKPFFDQYLKPGAPRPETPPVFIYNTGWNRWDRLTSWPASCERGCASVSRPIYLTSGFGLSFTAPAEGDLKSRAAFDEYVSDPSKPVPYLPRPVRFADGDAWRRWLLTDQRFIADRPDVLSYVTPPLTEAVQIAGVPAVNLVAATSGTDSDWVVKLIDVHPETVPSQPEMGGYQFPISQDIFRGRYRESFEHAKALTPGAPLEYKFTLPTVNHVFKPGHRIMVQIQSSQFPLYDRNPQTFVPNIFFSKPSDYVTATQRIYHAQGALSFIELPVVPLR